MPTLKASVITYNQQRSEKENLAALFDAHNDFVKRVTRTVNNLDEENLGDSLIELLGGNDGEDEQADSV